MNQFKVGDRVRCDIFGKEEAGIGTIRFIQLGEYAVEFEGDKKYHSCSGHIPSGKGWWVKLDELTLISSSHKPNDPCTKFQVGDEVVRISSSHLGMKVGDTAVITKQFNKTTSYCLDKYDGTHMGSNLQLVTNTKFKVGDVIIHNDLKYRKRTVLKIVNDNYQLYSHNSDTDDLELAIEYIDRKYHLADPSSYKFQVGDIIVCNKKFLSGDQKIRKVVEVTEDYYSVIKEFCTNTVLLSKDYLESNYELITNDLGYSAVNKYPEESKATKEPEAAMDKQVGGNHYNTMGLQPLEACYLRYGYSGFKAAIHTKVDKYFRTKTNEVEDLEKAKHCIEMLIEKAKLEATKK